MATKKTTNTKKIVYRFPPMFLVICAVISLILGLVIGLLIPTSNANPNSSALNAAKVEDLTVNTLAPEDPVTLKFKLSGLPSNTQMTLKIKHGEEISYLDCSSDGDYYSCDITTLTENPTHVTLVLTHKGTSVFLPLVRNLIRVDSSIGYLGVWDFQ